MFFTSSPLLPTTLRFLTVLPVGFFFFFFALYLSLVENLGRLTWVKLQQPQEQRYPFLTVHAVFSCVQTKVWLSILGVFNVRTDVDACDCTRGICGHRKRVCTESWLWEKNPLPHRGIEPASAACRSDAIPTELHPRPCPISVLLVLSTICLCMKVSFSPDNEPTALFFLLLTYSVLNTVGSPGVVVSGWNNLGAPT